MIIHHLSDSDIQEYVLGERQDVSVKRHIDNCDGCKAKVEVYRQMIIGIREQSCAEFDFDLSESVMANLQETHLPYRPHLLGLIILAGTVTMVTAGYLFGRYIVNLFPEVSEMPIYFVIATFITLFLFLGFDMIRKYIRQMDAINFN